jgi:hypothetical protein
MSGNVYVKFYTEEDAMTAKEDLNGRFYAGRHICAEFSPVTEFREARYVGGGWRKQTHAHTHSCTHTHTHSPFSRLSCCCCC